METCLEITDLTKRYGAVAAVDRLSLRVQKGEVLGLLGPNGAGKTTTLYMLCGLVKPTSGTVSLFGKDLRKDFLAIAPRMGVLVERPSFYEHLTARQNLVLSARLAGRETTIDRALDLVGLVEAGDRRVSVLSSGTRQRLGLALALLTEPELLLLDEPANGLDPEATFEMLRLLRRLAEEGGVTIVFSSHMLHEVETLCDRVAILNQGRLAACDHTDALLSYDQSHVLVLVDGAEAVARRLAEQPWVVSADASPGRVEVGLREPNVHLLAAFLVAGGYKVGGIIPRRKTLKEYFMETLRP